MPKYSIVMPVYGVEDFLCNAIQSVLNQTMRDYELILVDDESPDNCPQICDEYASKYSQIKVVHQKNTGLAGARNSGFEHITGQYVYFLDSDDTVQPDLSSFTTPFTNNTTISKSSYSGDYYLWIYAVDEAGNYTVARSEVFKFDNTMI